jgi:hypothetical protein
MQETDSATLNLAIKEFKDKYGLKTPLDIRIESIIREIKERKRDDNK